jgi:hypothetical protein
VRSGSRTKILVGIEGYEVNLVDLFYPSYEILTTLKVMAC